MTLTKFLVPTYTQMLTALAAWLKRAQAELPAQDAQALLSARLAPDMYPLATQVRFCCVQAQEATSRLQRTAPPAAVSKMLEEGQNAGEEPGTLDDALARIEQTLAHLASLPDGALDTEAEEPVALELAGGMIFDLTAEQFARDWATPQFYFHLMAAYSILRSQGVQLGKADYVPHMVGYLRG